MALSSSEHNLLVTTCDNMNVAANTCREVLEMLRNLGNTGVVDIAEHNNAQGRHSGDKTLIHGVVGTSTITYSAPCAAVDGSGNFVVEAQKYLVTKKVYGSTAGVIDSAGSHGNDIYFVSSTDSSGNTALLTANTTLTGRHAIRLSLYRLTDGTNSINAGFRFYARRPDVYSDTAGYAPYGSCSFFCSSGSYGGADNVIEFSSGGIIPSTTNSASLGHASKVWKDVYCVNSPTVTSDRREKTDITGLGQSAVELIKRLRPVSFRFVQGEAHIAPTDIDGNPLPDNGEDTPGVRTHWGLIAQEVKEAMTQAGIEDAAIWCLADKNDPDSQQSLRYEELIAPLVKAVQVLAAKVEALEGK